jgi:2-hydroxycyclohexanecarboxyl-CoA dehydrogenase
MKLEGKAAIITGAGSGIGRAAALLFAEQGAQTAVVDIRGKEADSVVDEIRNNGKEAVAVTADLTKFAEVRSMVDQVIGLYGKVDILVTNAGWDEFKLFIKQTAADWEFQIALNLMHHIYCCQAVIPHMMKRKYGKIVTCSSVTAQSGNTGEAVYAACKGAVISFSKSLAGELGKHNITVNCVAPGLIETPLVDEVLAKLADPNKGREDYISKSPLGRTGKPEDVAAAYLFLASDESSFITGQVLAVNGGIYM